MACAKLKCTGCKERFPRETMIKLNGSNFHSIDCATKYAYANKEKGKAIKHKAQKKKDAVRKKALMTRSQWYTKYKTVLHQWIMHVRDKGKPCFTCGKTDPSVKYDCGHRHHAGRGGGDRRRFILENIHKQCSVNCNQFGSGMPVEYDIALDKEYGEGFAERLKCVDNYPTLKEQFPIHEDIEKEIVKYRALLRENGITPNA